MNNTNTPMGFSGLSKLVSNIDKVCIPASSPKKVSPQPQAQPAQSAPSAKPSSPSTEKATETRSPQKSSAAPIHSPSPTTSQSSTSSVEHQEEKDKSVEKCFWGLFWVVVILLAMASVMANNDESSHGYSSSSSSTYSSSSSSYNNTPNYSYSGEPAPLATSTESKPTYSSSTSYGSTTNSTYDTAVSIPSPSEPTYTKPSIGTNNILSVPEIRWCVREKIRIEKMQDYVTSNRGINSVNSLIDDYNSRCGSYRYRSGALSQAQQDVEPFRSDIVREAVREAVALDGKLAAPLKTKSSASKASTHSPKKENSQSDLVRQAQQLLTDIGYAPGPVDGSYGRRTKEAIMIFQRHEGLVEDGIASESLLRSLKKAYKEYTSRHPEVTKKTSSTTRNYFTKGSHQSEVIRLQGTPQSVLDLIDEEQWSYGYSSVTISKKTKKVTSWSNVGNRLHVRMIPGKNVTTKSYFSKGSHQDDVIRLQGTPQTILDLIDEEQWSYGYSSVTISKNSKKVLRWSNSSNNLKVR